MMWIERKGGRKKVAPNAEARLVYQYVKTAARNTPGLQSVAEKLGERFKQTRTGEIAQAIKPAQG